MAIFFLKKTFTVTKKTSVYLWEKISNRKWQIKRLKLKQKSAIFPTDHKNNWRHPPVSSIELHIFDRRCVKKSSKMKTEMMLAVEMICLEFGLFCDTLQQQQKVQAYISFTWQPLWRNEQLISSQEAELTTRLKAQLVDLFLDWVSRMPFLTSFKGDGGVI